MIISTIILYVSLPPPPPDTPTAGIHLGNNACVHYL